MSQKIRQLDAIVQTACEGHSPSNAQTIFGEEKICIVLDGLRGERVAEPRRREGVAESLYYCDDPVKTAVIDWGCSAG